MKEKLAKKFRMTDGGPAELLLGMEIIQKPGEIVVSQHKYVLTILDKFNMADAKPVATPGSGPELAREPENAIYLDEYDTKLYQAIVGSLLFLTNTTRFDIGFATTVLCRAMSKPTNQHMAAAKRVLRYLRGNPDMTIKFKQGQWKLNGLYDANFAGASEALQIAAHYGISVHVWRRGDCGRFNSAEANSAIYNPRGDNSSGFSSEGGYLSSRSARRTGVPIREYPDTQ